MKAMCIKQVAGEYISENETYEVRIDGSVVYYRNPETGAGSWMRLWHWERAIARGEIVIL
jgi:type IV secretory pathway protease TraF